MNHLGGAATQICAHRFDRRYFDLPANIQQRVQRRIDELGRNLRSFPHYRMQGIDAFRLRIGDYRVIYQFDLEKNELHLVTIGHRRDIYKDPLN